MEGRIRSSIRTKEKRKGETFLRRLQQVYYRILNKLTDVDIPVDVVISPIDRKVCDALKSSRKESLCARTHQLARFQADRVEFVRRRLAEKPSILFAK